MTGEPRVAIVTGAARGIGAATVHGLVAEGWNVVAVDACADDPAVPYPMATRDELESLAGQQVRTVVADVRDEQAMHDAVAVAESEFGGLDAAVGAAAVIAGGKPLWETGREQWDVLHDVGVTGLFNLARAAVPMMLRRSEPRSGRFVAIASGAAHHGLWRLAAYNAAKHAVVGLTKGLATDLRGTGITAVAVSPGSTDTVMLKATAEIYELAHVDEFAMHQLLERILDPAEVAAAICWLCDEKASAVTGSVVHADGGFTG